MSFESSSDERTLSVETSGFSSAESSLAPSPTGILSPSSSHTASSTSLDTKPGVKFAPLPELAPRKRRGGPLGMAARTQMVARRRQQRRIYVDAYHDNPMWTEEELEQQRELAMREGQRRHAQHHLLAEEEEEGADDPFLALGRLVKGAGKVLWKKVSNKELSKQAKKEKETEATTHAEAKKSGESTNEIVESEQVEVQGEEEEEEEEETTPLDQQRYVRPPTPPVQGNHEDSADEDEESFQTIGQIRTIREGEWVTDDLLDDLTGKTPTQSNYVISH